jgi:periplasmic protein TonB
MKMSDNRIKKEDVNGNMIRVDFKTDGITTGNAVRSDGDGRPDMKKYLVFLASFLLHVLVLSGVLLFFKMSHNVKSVIPESIEILNYEEYIPPVEEKIQQTKKIKLEEDAVPENKDFKENENNVVKANPDGDDNAKNLSQTDGDNGDVDYMPQSKIDEAPVFPMADIKSRVVYPPLASKQEIEGLVVLELYIDDKGNIRKITVLKDPGYGFGEAAVRAFDKIKCVPAKSKGNPVAVRFKYPVRFTLNK